MAHPGCPRYHCRRGSFRADFVGSFPAAADYLHPRHRDVPAWQVHCHDTAPPCCASNYGSSRVGSGHCYCCRSARPARFHSTCCCSRWRSLASTPNRDGATVDAGFLLHPHLHADAVHPSLVHAPSAPHHSPPRTNWDRSFCVFEMRLNYLTRTLLAAKLLLPSHPLLPGVNQPWARVNFCFAANRQNNCNNYMIGLLVAVNNGDVDTEFNRNE